MRVSAETLIFSPVWGKHSSMRTKASVHGTEDTNTQIADMIKRLQLSVTI